VGKRLILILLCALMPVLAGAGADHWAFKAPVRPDVPKVAADNPIDAFIRARLANEKLTPSPQADRRTLIRRVYFDVIGLPPSPDEVEAFITDPDPRAYEKLVDRLLASPRYGERWARHWLDVVRFAESNGFETNVERRNAYHYRDWVIKAFNDDMPYDRFVRAQIAGDGTNDDSATGFLVGGTTDIVKSPDPVLTANQRADELHDMVSTTGSAFLGLTVGCARCHDHKFDPISQVDYYRMVAVFAGVQHGERALVTPEATQQTEKVASIMTRLREVNHQVDAYQALAHPDRTFILVDEPQVSQLVPALGREPYFAGVGPGERRDPGNSSRLPNVGRGYFFWNRVAGKNVFSWNPQKSGQYRLWLSWGCGHPTHATDASYFLDVDGDLTTTSDRVEIAKVNQQRFADGSGDKPPAKPLWSGFRDAGVHELNAKSRIVLRGGAREEDYVSADVLLLEEMPSDVPGLARPAVSSSQETQKTAGQASRGTGMPAIRSGVRALRNVECFEPVKAKFVRFTILETTDAEPCIDELEIFAAGDPRTNIALASAGAKTSASGTYPNAAIHKLEHLNDGRYGNEFSWISNEFGKGWVQVELREPAEISQIVWARDRNAKFHDRLAKTYRIEVALDANGPWRLVASQSDRLPFDAFGEPIEVFRLQRDSKTEDGAKLDALIAERVALRESLAKVGGAETKAYVGTFQQPAETFRMARGDPMQPKEEVTPGAIATIGQSLDLAKITPEHERRAKLAAWITDPSNPLTARVIVNRLWHYHFGRGVVSTPSDFGNMGAKPTHPELLDWLATELVAQGWKLKSIHRLILLSETYQQSSTPRADAMQRDAQTTLLWRYPARRLEAEAIRDAILSVGGQLDLTMGGPGFDVFKPNDNYVRVYEPKTDWSKAEFRRMIYATKIRSQQDGTFGAFDCPDGAQIAPKRPSSTTPLQALNLLNGSFVLQQSEYLAERLKSDVGLDPKVEVDRAFRIAFARPATAEERDAGAELIRQHGLPAFCRALLNANEFVYVR
jgi:hypothetical protein